MELIKKTHSILITLMLSNVFLLAGCEQQSAEQTKNIVHPESNKTERAAVYSPSQMKMTTEIPAGVTTPDRLETRIGTLNLFDGIPDEATTQKVYDNLDFQRGVQAYLNCLQIASLSGMRHAYLEFGPANTTALLFETLMDSKALYLTPNTTSVYMVSWLEIGKEPMVLQTPPDVLGFN